MHGCSDATPQLDLAKCDLTAIAGGGFADIYQGTLLGGKKVAIKCPRVFIKNDERGKNVLKELTREIYIWSKLVHENVLELVRFTMFRDHLAVVSPWMENGTLPDYISKYPEVDRFHLCTQVCAGLAYLHSSDTVHGDVKGASQFLCFSFDLLPTGVRIQGNVLISETGTAKLTDFGNTHLKKYTLEFSGTVSSSRISIRWTSLELLAGDTLYTKEADMYALGMTFLETVTGKVPFADKIDQAVIFLVMNGKTPERPNELDDMDENKARALWAAMSQCWSQDPGDRPSATEVELQLQSPFSVPADST